MFLMRAAGGRGLRSATIQRGSTAMPTRGGFRHSTVRQPTRGSPPVHARHLAAATGFGIPDVAEQSFLSITASSTIHVY